MTLFITVLHVLVCIFLIGVVLLQRGKGAEVGAMFGGGGSATMFGSRGAGNFLTRLTTGSATVFMLTSLFLAFASEQAGDSDLLEGAPGVAPVTETSPFEEVGGFEEVETIPADPGASEPSATAPDAGVPATRDPGAAEPTATDPDTAPATP